MLPWNCVTNIYIFVSICFRTFQMTAAYLFYPNNTVIQITASISYPIADLPPKRKVLWDWGIQMNYMMPYDPASFYNVPIWPVEERFNVRNRRFSEVVRKYMDSFNSTDSFPEWMDAIGNRHIFDFTAGELYRAIERLIESYGYHSSCLFQSVCDLAKHPFEVEQRHLIIDLIAFILTPSWHLGFHPSEDEQRKAYEAAEKSGIRGLDCKKLYPICRKSLLDVITYVIFDNN
ncbi:uncharacterized protein LOC128857831 [Anastrepha ludens]|uniref:uncharacterized protein LOC128857831 n=1 Tax=Anastrepha ludens TaxID=28586 RepID=UPI0023AFC361|nr:uncharacterized protein LOC128857831 [Anastrepha ludens]